MHLLTLTVLVCGHSRDYLCNKNEGHNYLKKCLNFNLYVVYFIVESFY